MGSNRSIIYKNRMYQRNYSVQSVKYLLPHKPLISPPKQMSRTALLWFLILPVGHSLLHKLRIFGNIKKIIKYKKDVKHTNDIVTKTAVNEGMRVNEGINSKIILPSSSPPSYTFSPIGHLSTPYPLCVGTPRQGSLSPSSQASLKLDLNSGSVEGLHEFSHVWITFVFHLNTKGRKVRDKIKPPSLGGTKVGVLATRTPHRYNNVGMTLCRLEYVKIVKNKPTLQLSGLDLCDGTPVLDVKPYVPHYDSVGSGLEGGIAGECRVPRWINEGLKLRRSVTLKEGVEGGLEGR